MDMKFYQRRALTTAKQESLNLTYMALGLAGESGEVANKLKKVIRGDYTENDIKDAIIDELGDVLWYVAGVASVLGVDLDDVASANIRKLTDRKDRNVIQGDGDER